MVACSHACTFLDELSHTLATTLIMNPKGGKVCSLWSVTELSLEVTKTSQILSVRLVDTRTREQRGCWISAVVELLRKGRA